MEKGYHAATPPSRWEEAALCGNGTIGAIAMCRPLRETVILSHEKLFLPQNPKMPPPDTGAHLEKIRALLSAGEYAAAAARVVGIARSEGYSGGLHWTDSFLPACDLCVDLAEAGPVQSYRRALDFGTGAASVEWDDARGHLRRDLFVSRADHAVVLRMTAEGGRLDGSVDLLRHPPDDEERWLRGTDRHLERFGRVEHTARTEDGPGGPAGRLDLVCGFRDAAFGYLCTVRVVADRGTLHARDGRIVFEGASGLLILARVEYFPDFSGADADSAAEALRALPAGYDALLARHVPLHAGLFNRLDLRLGGQFSREAAEPVTDSGPAAEELWAQSRSGEPCGAVYERLFHAGRYHVLSSSGATPPNLQGIWTGTYTVPWSSDYTQNGNTQTAILGLLPGNMHEALLAYFDYQESLLPDYRENARRLYRCRGIHLPSRTSNHGLNNHFNENWCHTFWTAGAGWAAHFYYDYWLYTRDDAFFRDRALPFMKEAALFYEDFLTEGPDGTWIFSPSYSPENQPAGIDAQACVNATMDIAVARELFGNLLEGCRTLGIESENLPAWQRMLDRMPPYRINADGALQEWCHDGLADTYDHRHASHLYPLFYGIAREIRDDPALYSACAEAYRIRLRERRKELGVMAFGLVQLGFSAAHLGDAETVGLILQTLAGGYYYSNFMSSHDAGPHTFNVDIGGGFPALVMETVLQSRPLQTSNGSIESWELQLLPCLPAPLGEGHLRGVRARGGFELDITWSGGALVRAEIANPLGARCTVRYGSAAVRKDAFRHLTLTPDDFIHG
ncbi:MAG: glycoside hydrolase N-terminal domain-containing protein [Clostridia bacterium]|nr:glycoside hydrolase N-terminal domain-containing protein [Clostridia bacterium]